MPRCVERLIEVALCKAICEQVGFTKAQSQGDMLTFTVVKPDLALWSEIFSGYKGMRFSPSGDSVIYKFKGAEPSSTAKAILLDYYKAYIQENKEKENEG
jgi:hypothetical protein